MARFGDLPEEMVLSVWPFIPTNTVESFALTCRRVYRLCAKTLTEYNVSKKRYKVLVNETRRDYLSVATQARQSSRSELLINPIVDLFRNPGLEHHMKQVVVAYLAEDWFNTFGNDERERETTGNIDVLHHILNNCKYLREKEAVEWSDLIKRGYEDPMLGLLLYLLPNDRTINFDPYDKEPTKCLDLVKRMTWDQSCSALSRLSEVIIESAEPDHTSDLSAITTFAMLPSVTTISGKYITDDGDFSTKWWESGCVFTPRGSNVKRLDLIEANLPSTCFYRLIGIFNALETFDYQPIPERWSEYMPWPPFDPYAIRHALARHSKSTLKTMSLTAGKRQKRFMGPIRDFESLTSLTTDWRLLLRPGRLHSPELSEALPPSIEDVTLITDTLLDAKIAVNLIEDLLSSKDVEHPNLCYFVLDLVPENAEAVFKNSNVYKLANENVQDFHIAFTPNKIIENETR